MIYNFNINQKNGKTYYEENLSWKRLKIFVKNTLDEKHSDKYTKILKILSACEDYKNRYL